MKRAHDFVLRETNVEINRNNQMLLSKLVEISNGKFSSVPKSGELPPLPMRASVSALARSTKAISFLQST